MNILITGIHGFVGSNLVLSLKTNHHIYGLDIVSPKMEGVQKTFSWDELDQIPSIDLIVHLAGKAHDTKSQTEAFIYFEINTGLTKRIFDWFLTSDAKKFIFFSSVKAAADNVGTSLLTEDVVPSPKGPYGESKLAAEEYVTTRLHVYTTARGGDEANGRRGETEKGREEATARGGEEKTSRLHEHTTSREGDEAMGREGEEAPGREGEIERKGARRGDTSATLSAGKQVYILRPCMIHGPGNKGNLNLLYNVVKKGIPYPLGAFENKRSFTSIDNLSFIITQIIEKEIPGGIYNVADDESVSTNELIALMAETLKKPNRIWKLNKSFLLFCAKMGTLLHLPLNTTRLQKLTESYVVSNNKIKQALGIPLMPVSAKEGLRKTLESFGK